MNSNKIILVPENTLEIQEAIQEFKNSKVSITKQPILPKNWYEQVISSLNENQQNLIKNANLNIQEDNLIFQSFASLFLKQTDALLIGHHYTSKEVFLYTILFFGQNSFLSSAFVCDINNNLQVWSDCAFNIQPTAEMLAKIAINAGDFYKQITQKQPNLAFLSYATFDSAKGKPVELVLESLKHFENLNINKYDFQGPLQFDSAINLNVYNKKTKSESNQEFNTLIFPDLNSGNISYKVANQLTNIEFFGPFVLGTNSLVCDLSRSAKKNEILKTLNLIAQFLE